MSNTSPHWTDVFANETAPATPQPRRAARQNRNVTEANPWTMTRVDALPGGRNNFVCVMVPNPKQAGSIAHEHWSLYGEVMKPSVTVVEYIKSYPTQDGGVTRAQRSLTWDLDHGFIRLLPASAIVADKVTTETATVANGTVTQADTSAPEGFGSRINGGNAGDTTKGKK